VTHTAPAAQPGDATGGSARSWRRGTRGRDPRDWRCGRMWMLWGARGA